jgi:hypothetical protein
MSECIEKNIVNRTIHNPFSYRRKNAKDVIYLERGIDIQGTLTVRAYSDIILKNEMLEENFVPKGIALITF